MAHDLVITDLKDDEIDLLQCLVDEFVLSHGSIRYKDNYWSLLRGWLLRIKNEEDACVLVAKLGPKIVGFVVTQIKNSDPLLLPEKVGYGHMMVVATEFRCEGAGEALWNTTKEWLMLKGIEQVETFTEIGNRAAEDFWAKRGLTPFMQKRRCYLL